MLDGHQTRFEWPTLEYITDKNHEWALCIGVPYGTALWQVGDSTEQNGCFKMSLAKGKTNLLYKKIERKLKNPSIQPTDLMPLINDAWKASFARIDKNKKAICDRGWYPYNRMLLLGKKLRETMTTEDKVLERNKGFIRREVVDVEQKKATYEQKFLIKSLEENKELNFGNGVSKYCLESLVSSQQLQTARENVKKQVQEGKSLQERLESLKKISAGKIFKAGTNQIGQTIFDLKRDNDAKAKSEAEKAKRDRKEEFCRKVLAILPIIEKNREQEYINWTNADLKLMVRFLKQKPDDEKLPKENKALMCQYVDKYKHRLNELNEYIAARKHFILPTSIAIDASKEIQEIEESDDLTLQVTQPKTDDAVQSNEE